MVTTIPEELPGEELVIPAADLIRQVREWLAEAQGNADKADIDDAPFYEGEASMAYSVLKLALGLDAEVVVIVPDDRDYSSSASRQHWIDTGRYLKVGEA